MIYPRLTRVREVSATIAARVIHIAQEEVCHFCGIHEVVSLILYLQKVDKNTALRNMDDHALLAYVQKKSWYPSVKTA